MENGHLQFPSLLPDSQLDVLMAGAQMKLCYFKYNYVEQMSMQELSKG